MQNFRAAFVEDIEVIGLKNIITRIEYLKGMVKFISSPGKVTTVKVCVLAS